MAQMERLSASKPHTLKAVGLMKSYKGRAVVNGASFEVHSGQVVGLLGPNGAGKNDFVLHCGGPRQARWRPSFAR